MSAADDYLERLRNIREKYGCANSMKETAYRERANSVSLHHPAALKSSSSLLRSPEGASALLRSPERASASGIIPTYAGSKGTSSYGLGRLAQETVYSRPRDYESFDKKKLIDSQRNNEPRMRSKIENRISFGHPSQENGRTNDRNRQIEQIRQTYAANRRKVMEEFEHRYTEQDAVKKPDYKDLYAREDYIVTDEYSRKSYPKLDLESRHRPLSKTNYLGEESISPIKRMAQYVGDTTRKLAHVENLAPVSMSPARPKESNDRLWREREARLSELTSNKLNEYRFSNPKQDWSRQKKMITSTYHDSGKKVLNGSPSRRSNRYGESENKGKEYNVSNIQRIQQRIQSILGPK